MARRVVDDPTMMSCCERDAADQKQAAEWKAELHLRDPVEHKLNAIRHGGALSSAAPRHNHDHATPPFSLPNGTPTETDECSLFHLIEGASDFFICLAYASSSSTHSADAELEHALNDYLDGFPCPIVVHRFRPHSTCRSAKCLVTSTMQLPALLVFAQGRLVVQLERNRLEAESEGALIARLSRLKQTAAAEQQKQKADGDADEDEDSSRMGRNKYFMCGKAGCDRTFHHVHVKSTYKYEQQQEAADSDDDDEDDDDD